MSLDAGAHDLRPEGKISHCDSCIAECQYFCCDFDHDPASGNFMVMYPGEYERAVADGWDMTNIEVIGPDADGGLRFTTPHRLCCQIPLVDADGAPVEAPGTRGRYKSFECRVYPLWPYLHANEWRFRISERCPIQKRDLDVTAQMVEIRAEVMELARDPKVRRWFQQQRCAGKYKEYPNRFDKAHEAVILPPELSPSSLRYRATVNGRLVEAGVRAAEGSTIPAALVTPLADLLLAGLLIELADCEYINLYRAVDPALAPLLKRLVLDATAETRRRLGAPLPIVRVVDVPLPTLPAGGDSGAPTLEFVWRATSRDGLEVAKWADELDGGAGPRIRDAMPSLLQAVAWGASGVTLGAEWAGSPLAACWPTVEAILGRACERPFTIAVRAP